MKASSNQQPNKSNRGLQVALWTFTGLIMQLNNECAQLFATYSCRKSDSVCKLRMRVEDHFARICAPREAVKWYIDCACVRACVRVCVLCICVLLFFLLCLHILRINEFIRTTDQIFMNILSLNFGSHPQMDLDQRNFWRTFTTVG